jgi:hypothetical protein
VRPPGATLARHGPEPHTQQHLLPDHGNGFHLETVGPFGRSRSRLLLSWKCCVPQLHALCDRDSNPRSDAHPGADSPVAAAVVESYFITARPDNVIFHARYRRIHPVLDRVARVAAPRGLHLAASPAQLTSSSTGFRPAGPLDRRLSIVVPR